MALIQRIIIQWCAPVFGLLGIAIVIQGEFAGVYQTPFALLITSTGAVALLVAPLLARAGASFSVIGLMLSLVIGTGLYIDAWATGGVQGAVVPTLIAIPILAAFFSGPRVAITIALFISLLLTILVLAPSPLPAMQESRAYAFALIGLWAQLILVVSFYALVQRIGANVFGQRDQAGAEAATTNQFLMSFSHDLRTPLNAVLGMSELLKLESDAVDDATVRERARLINESGQHMLSMLNDILLFAKMDSKEIALELGQCDIVNVAVSQVNMARVKAAERDQKITFKTGTLPSDAMCDGKKTGRLIGNLIGNALKYSPSATIVDVSMVQDGQTIVIKVADSGCGMSPEEIETALRPFGQVQDNSGHDPASKGVGLGFNICQEIVELHGGTLSIESEKGRGTCVTVRLPVGQDARLDTVTG